MPFIRVKTRGGRRYAYLVESVWRPESGSPRQRVLRYLGPADEVKPGDLPPKLRKEPAVARWLAENAGAATRAYERGLAARRAALRDALLEADRAAVRRLARGAIERLGEWTFLEDVVTPLLHEVGEDWYAGRITVADEHVVTRGIGAVVRDVGDDVRRAASRRRSPRARVVLANPEGEQHALALEVLECRLAMDRHPVLVISGGLPRRDLATRAREFDADLVLISATMQEARREAVRAAEAVVERCPRALVALGGQAWRDADPPARLHPRIRVARGPTSESVAALVREALEARPVASRVSRVK